MEIKAGPLGAGFYFQELKFKATNKGELQQIYIAAVSFFKQSDLGTDSLSLDKGNFYFASRGPFLTLSLYLKAIAEPEARLKAHGAR